MRQATVTFFTPRLSSLAEGFVDDRDVAAAGGRGHITEDVLAIAEPLGVESLLAGGGCQRRVEGQ